MDFINKAAKAMGGSSSNNNNNVTADPNLQQQQPAAGGAVQKDDYVDKGFSAALNKAGFGSKVSRDNQEKITDKARELYEKQTGKKVSDKISN
ncbi:hypothetical protein BX600DRAFT_461019 [Xylariales sp. PMI_506]|nr:hypothetical protein BX600DRAFT_461019 [Xylariales sp. PMI_506]